MHGAIRSLVREGGSGVHVLNPCTPTIGLDGTESWAGNATTKARRSGVASRLSRNMRAQRGNLSIEIPPPYRIAHE